MNQAASSGELLIWKTRKGNPPLVLKLSGAADFSVHAANPELSTKSKQGKECQVCTSEILLTLSLACPGGGLRAWAF